MVWGPTPAELAPHRVATWPVATSLPGEMALIYDVVKGTSIPNALSTKIQLPTELHIDAWLKHFGDEEQCSIQRKVRLIGSQVIESCPTMMVDSELKRQVWS